jgi:uncharacterized repeat protein (TIGR01451 family)
LVWDTEKSYIENTDYLEILPVAWYDGAVTCQTVEKPDLEITEKSEEWVSLDNMTYNILYTVCNTGDADAGKSNTTITIDGDVMEDPIEALAAGACSTRTVGPFTMTGNRDTIVVCADNMEEVEESNEENNCRENEFVYLEMPDLEITKKSEEWVSLDNMTYNITYTVCNTGDADAGNSNTTITIGGADVMEDPIEALAAGDCTTRTVGPFTMTGNSDTIVVCADNKGEVEESNEENNCLENEFVNPGMDTWTCYLEPQNSTGECDAPTIVSLKVNITRTGYYGWLDPRNGVCSYQDDIHYDLGCVNVTNVDQSMSPFTSNEWQDNGNFVHIYSSNVEELPIGVHTIANLTLECNCGGAPCFCNLTHENCEATDADFEQVSQEWTDGTYRCMAESPYIKLDIRADGIASNILNVTDYMICPGTVTEDGITIDNETAMGALVIYCQNNGINIHITMYAGSEYVLQIGDNADDEDNWVCAVNGEVVGGAQKAIVDGDRVHWYNNNLHYYEVLTALDKAEIDAGDFLTATVTLNETNGTHLTGARVYVGALGPWGPESGTLVGTTGADGTCTFSWPTVGTGGVYAVDPVHGSGQYNWPYVTFICRGAHNVKIEKSSSPSTVSPGGIVNYIITYKNTGSMDLINVTITENYPEGVKFISALPSPVSGNNKWTRATLKPEESGEINITVKVSKSSKNTSIRESGSISGEGFVMVSKDISTEQESYTLKNVVTLTCNEAGPISAIALTTVGGVPVGTSLEIVEHGSGIYSSDEVINTHSKDQSIRLEKSTEAEYKPIPFRFSDGFSTNFSSKKISDASYMLDDTVSEVDNNSAYMKFESLFNGSIHIGVRTNNTRISEDYIGDFNVVQVINISNKNETTQKEEEEEWIGCP